MLAEGSRNRRAGALLAGGVSAEQVPAVLGCAAEALDAVPLIVDALDRDEIACPATRGLAEVIAGRTTPDDWIEELLDRAAGGERRAALARAG